MTVQSSCSVYAVQKYSQERAGTIGGGSTVELLHPCTPALCGLQKDPRVLPLRRFLRYYSHRGRRGIGSIGGGTNKHSQVSSSSANSFILFSSVQLSFPVDYMPLPTHSHHPSCLQPTALLTLAAMSCMAGSRSNHSLNFSLLPLDYD